MFKSRKEAEMAVAIYQVGTLLKSKDSKAFDLPPLWEPIDQGNKTFFNKKPISRETIYMVISCCLDMNSHSWTGRVVFQLLDNHKVSYFFCSDPPHLFFEILQA